uniref:Uncharacterized protein n=1 Tax=viral metagenome TaxID=1070528 RepID=A0A6C0EZW6_9ZZZZ
MGKTKKNDKHITKKSSNIIRKHNKKYSNLIKKNKYYKSKKYVYSNNTKLNTNTNYHKGTKLNIHRGGFVFNYLKHKYSMYKFHNLIKKLRKEEKEMSQTFNDYKIQSNLFKKWSEDKAQIVSEFMSTTRKSTILNLVNDSTVYEEDKKHLIKHKLEIITHKFTEIKKTLDQGNKNISKEIPHFNKLTTKFKKDTTKFEKLVGKFSNLSDFKTKVQGLKDKYDEAIAIKDKTKLGKNYKKDIKNYEQYKNDYNEVVRLTKGYIKEQEDKVDEIHKFLSEAESYKEQHTNLSDTISSKEDDLDKWSTSYKQIFNKMDEMVNNIKNIQSEMATIKENINGILTIYLTLYTTSGKPVEAEFMKQSANEIDKIVKLLDLIGTTVNKIRGEFYNETPATNVIMDSIVTTNAMNYITGKLKEYYDIFDVALKPPKNLGGGGRISNNSNSNNNYNTYGNGRGNGLVNNYSNMRGVNRENFKRMKILNMSGGAAGNPNPTRGKNIIPGYGRGRGRGRGAFTPGSGNPYGPQGALPKHADNNTQEIGPGAPGAPAVADLATNAVIMATYKGYDFIEWKIEIKNIIEMMEDVYKNLQRTDKYNLFKIYPVNIISQILDNFYYIWLIFVYLFYSDGILHQFEAVPPAGMSLESPDYYINVGPEIDKITFLNIRNSIKCYYKLKKLLDNVPAPDKDKPYKEYEILISLFDKWKYHDTTKNLFNKLEYNINDFLSNNSKQMNELFLIYVTKNYNSLLNYGLYGVKGGYLLNLNPDCLNSVKLFYNYYRYITTAANKNKTIFQYLNDDKIDHNTAVPVDKNAFNEPIVVGNLNEYPTAVECVGAGANCTNFKIPDLGFPLPVAPAPNFIATHSKKWYEAIQKEATIEIDKDLKDVKDAADNLNAALTAGTAKDSEITKLKQDLADAQKKAAANAASLTPTPITTSALGTPTPGTYLPGTYSSTSVDTTKPKTSDAQLSLVITKIQDISPSQGKETESKCNKIFSSLNNLIKSDGKIILLSNRFQELSNLLNNLKFIEVKVGPVTVKKYEDPIAIKFNWILDPIKSDAKDFHALESTTKIAELLKEITSKPISKITSSITGNEYTNAMLQASKGNCISNTIILDKIIESVDNIDKFIKKIKDTPVLAYDNLTLNNSLVCLYSRINNSTNPIIRQKILDIAAENNIINLSQLVFKNKDKDKDKK